MNDHLKHIVCFISIYLTEELSANCMYSAVNVYMIFNQWDAAFDSFRH